MKNYCEESLRERQIIILNFHQLCQLLKKLRFEERIRGDHYIFTKDNIEEIINIQPKGEQS